MSSAARRVRAALRRSTAPLVTFSVAGCLSLAVGVSAAEYSIDPSINSRLTVDDNVLLNEDGSEIETVFFEIKPRVRLRRATEKWQADVDLSVSTVLFEDDEFNTDNQNLTVQLTRRAETMTFQVIALNDRQTTRIIELDQVGDIGFGIERRDRQFLRPSVTWILNQKNQIAVGVSGDNVHFGGTAFSDYDNYSGDVAWTHQYDEKTQFSVSAFGSDFSSVVASGQASLFDGCPDSPVGFPFAVPSTPDNIFGFLQVPVGTAEDFSSETLGVQVGGSRQPTSRLSFRGSVGYRQVDTTAEGRCADVRNVGPDRFSTTSESTGVILDTGFDYKGESYDVSVSLSRSVSPAGLGSIFERDDLRASWAYRLNELVTVSLTATAFDLQTLDPDRPLQRDGYQIAPRIQWQLNKKLSLNGGLIYRTTEALAAPGARDGFSTYAGFNYNFKPIRFTR